MGLGVGGRLKRDRGICTHIADSCCIAETNTTL